MTPPPRLKEKTHSLWSYLLAEQQNYENPLYSPALAETQPILEPSTLPCHFKCVSILSCPSVLLSAAPPPYLCVIAILCSG